MAKQLTLLCAVLLLTLFCFGTVHPQSADPNKIGITERAWIASKLYSSIQIYFGHWQAVPDLDLDAVYKKYLEQTLATDDRMAFDLATMEFLAQLRNGHTRFHDKWLREAYGQPLGFFLTRLDDKWVVTRTRINDLARGDIVQSVDGMPMDEFFARKRKYISASSEAAQRNALFYSPYLFPETFLLKLEDGRAVRIQRKGQKLKPSSPSLLEGRVMDDGIVYLRIPSFEKLQDEEKAVEFVKQHAGAKCMIIDVRGNGGGTTPQRLIRALMDRPYRDWTQSSSMSVGLFGAYRQIPIIVSPDQLSERQRGYFEAFSGYFDRPQFMALGTVRRPENPFYTGPLLILTDNDCASACEDFVMPLKVSGRARVVGQTTYGSSGQPYIYDFGNGMVLFVSSKRMSFPDGSPFEGVGITPDVRVGASLEEIRKDTDATLNKALEHARTIISDTKNR